MHSNAPFEDHALSSLITLWKGAKGFTGAAAASLLPMFIRQVIGCRVSCTFLCYTHVTNKNMICPAMVSCVAQW